MTVLMFDATVRAAPGAAVVDLVGEINAFAEEALNRAYSEAEALQQPRIVLNFSGVHYINSTGIALIVALLTRALKTERSLGVYGLSDHYKEIFQITRLADYLTIYPDEASALNDTQARGRDTQ